MNKGVIFALGGVAGAAAALMLSPRSGAENRELVAEKVDELSAQGTDVFQNAADTVRDRVQGVGQVSIPQTDELHEKINAARDRIAEQVMRSREEAQEVAAEMVDDVSDAAEDIAAEEEPAAKVE